MSHQLPNPHINQGGTGVVFRAEAYQLRGRLARGRQPTQITHPHTSTHNGPPPEETSPSTLGSQLLEKTGKEYIK